MENKYLNDLVKTTRELTLLYVEDCEKTRTIALDFLGVFFSNIVTAVDGEDGWNKYNSQSFDLVITDINMPILSGLGMAKKIRSRDENIPILVLSAFNDTEYFLESIRCNIDAYLIKPFEMDQFITHIFKVVKKIDDEKKLLNYKLKLEDLVKERTQELEYSCMHEYHTDLPNSVMLQTDLRAYEFDYMLLLDISHFSVLNKEYGKEFANHVITRTARVLEKHIHRNAKLYKTESDRFAILLKNVDVTAIYEYCDQIISFFDTKNIQVDETELHITFNIGVDKVRSDISQTLINCEYALDKSKELGSRHYELYSETISHFQDEKEAVKWLKLTRKLVLEEHIEPYFQPIQDVKSGKITKYEVLARGILDDEVISPIYFISQSEKLGLSSAITRAMINKSFAFFSDKDYEFSINLCERDLLEGYLIKYLKEKLKQYGIASSRVTFEILENVTVVKNSKMITEELNRLREMGFFIAVDDFGIENSNFSRLLQINLDFIKIDGLFIKGLKQNTRNRTITRAIVNLAKTLGIKTVAEYVEDEEIYEIIKECGIDYAQGYYVGKPEPELHS